MYFEKDILQKIKEVAQRKAISVAEYIRQLVFKEVSVYGNSVNVCVESEDCKLFQKYTTDVGHDLKANENILLEQNKPMVIKTGIKLSLPENIEGQIRPRSGLSAKGIIILNSPGTIDPGYTGEVCVIMMNLTDVPYNICKYERIAQIVFKPCIRPEIKYVREETFGSFFSTESIENRKDKGFGSTGNI